MTGGAIDDDQVDDDLFALGELNELILERRGFLLIVAYRLRLERDGNRVRLITRGGHNWTARYPWIVEAARKVRQKHFVLDGEAQFISEIV